MGEKPSSELSSAPARDFKTVYITIGAGVISAIATIGAAYLGGFFDVAKTNAVSLGTINLERLKFSNELVKGALATSNPANSLLFYADIGLLDGLNLDKVKDYAGRERDRIKSGGGGNSLLPSFDRTTRPKLWLDRDFVTGFAPHALPAYVNALVSTGNYLLQGFGIDENPKRLSMFLAQLAHETGGFFEVVENGNYSKARLLSVWPHIFDEQKAQQYANKPDAIFNLVYADKMGNGPESSGDGWKYRGRGFLQFTGRTNYDRFSKEIGIDLVANPDIMSDPNVSLLIATSFWYNSGLNALADEDRLEDVTKKLFGGSFDVPGRKQWVDRIAKLLAQKYP